MARGAPPISLWTVEEGKPFGDAGCLGAALDGAAPLGLPWPPVRSMSSRLARKEMQEETVILVDPLDNEIGTISKELAHVEGRLHRAVSVFVFNRSGRVLLQRRAADKYHSGGLWSNACCSHPRPGEDPHQAAARRLEEEMGLRYPLEYVFAFLYRAELDSGVTEHEIDHVFVGIGDEDPRPDSREVMDWRWTDAERLERELAEHPDRFTAWFPLAYRGVRGKRPVSHPVHRR